MLLKTHSTHSLSCRATLLLALVAILTLASTRMRADTGTCNGQILTLPFTDVQGNAFFCQIAAAYFSGLTNGTTATTYSPGNVVTREQMAAFTSRTLDQSLKRGSLRAATKKWWRPRSANALGLTDLGVTPSQVEFDGADLWVTSFVDNSVVRVRASDGKVLGTWTGATEANGFVFARGRVYVTGDESPGKLYVIDPTQPAGAVTTVSSSLGNAPRSITFDGSRLWTANAGGSVSIISFSPTAVTTVSTGFTAPYGILYDGTLIWVTDLLANSLHRLNSNGSIAQTITVGNSPHFPVFDGTNIWVPNSDSSTVTVVRVKDAAGNPLAQPFVLATLTGNGLDVPHTAAFDGERILVTNFGGNTVSLWKAADLTPLGSVSTENNTFPRGACSDGINFWITLAGTEQLARF
jgi:DNA-binding beta-propeller fold protein YncE